MSHTNSTANLGLPQFIGTDKPTWLSDVNGAFAAIDSYAGSNDAALAITDGKADTAIADASNAVTTAGNAATTAGNAAATATAANTVAGNALTVANGINAKVGVLTDLTTTDKSTVVNAINEVNGKDAADIPYDNTGSGLTATDVQAAIDEVAQGGGGSSETVLWTNADPSQTFAAQPVTVSDMSGYSKIRIEFIDQNTCKSEGSITIPPEGATGYSYGLTRIFEQTGDLRIATRNFDYTNATTITFSDGKIWSGFSTGGTQNAYVIPTKIIGID